jgi:RNA polymerase sigma-70 factor (ECF subfamily)
MDEWTRLALEAQSGTESARTAFVCATHADVWRLCAHLGDVEWADDLAQETFLRVFRSLPTYRAEAPVRSWLFSIVRRVVADDIGRRQRHRREHAPAVPHANDHAGGVAAELMLDHLDPDRRSAFVLTQLWGFSYEAAASICECPVGTIRSRVSRAREQLLGMLDDVGDCTVDGTGLSSETA